jgi:hypothetical protein
MSMNTWVLQQLERNAKRTKGEGAKPRQRLAPSCETTPSKEDGTQNEC